MQEDKKRKEVRDNKVISKLNREKQELQNKLDGLLNQSSSRRTQLPPFPMCRSSAETQTPVEEEKFSLDSYKLTDVYSTHSRIYEITHQTALNKGKIQKVFSDGHILLEYPDGMRQERYQNKYKITYFANKDIKQDFPDGSTHYFFAETNTFQRLFPDGTKIIRFNTGQIEKHYPNGTKKITFPDGTVKRATEGEEEVTYIDGVIEKTDKQGSKVLIHPGGLTESLSI